MAKAGYVGVGGVAKKIKNGWVGVGGVNKKIKNGWVGVGGVAKQCLSSGVQLSGVVEGSIIRLTEGSSLVDFYVAKHNYESGLNGSGLTLLVRTSNKTTMKFHETNSSEDVDYAISGLRTYLTGTYYNSLGADVQNIIKSTKYYWTDMVTEEDGSWTIAYGSKTTRSDKVFTISVAELGQYNPNKNMHNEGETLPIASTLLSSGTTSSSSQFWTRTVVYECSSSPQAYRTNYSGTNKVTNASVVNTAGVRPCFAIPSSTLVTQDGNNYILAN